MQTLTARQLINEAKTFESLREDAIKHGMLIIGFMYGVSALRLYDEAIAAMAAGQRR